MYVIKHQFINAWIKSFKNVPSCFYTLKHEDVLDPVLIIIFTQYKNKIIPQNKHFSKLLKLQPNI